jgi:hypothetical protein
MEIRPPTSDRQVVHTKIKAPNSHKPAPIAAEPSTTLLNRTKFWLEIGAAVVTIAGIIFAVVQYLQIEHDGRVTATLGYVARFNAPPIIDAFQKEFELWEKPEGHAMLYSTADAETQAQQQRSFIEKNNLKWDAILLGDFYDQLYVCLREEICDAPLAMAMLGRDIEAVFLENGDYLSYMRTTQHFRTGCGLVALFNIAHEQLSFQRLPESMRRKRLPPEIKIPANACGAEAAPVATEIKAPPSPSKTETPPSSRQ